uniref:TIL domain-containing protein n=1 Tax=Knipowitschia caucasica TaxID=637954 RepID=A0AAV2MG63_KNICA
MGFLLLHFALLLLFICPCQAQGEEVTDEPAMNCQPHSHFEECASPCQGTCPFPEPNEYCITVCVEGCVCDQGYVMSAGVCIPKENCGCSYRGRYYKPGQRFWEGPGCGRLCKCDTTLGMVVCKKASCSPKEKCSVVEGIRACRPLAHVHPRETLTA